MASSSPEEQQRRQQEQEQHQRRDEPVKECVHKTKTVRFLGRPTPFILQNDNGPCPLLAICNVLLLRNQLNLNPDITEVSQEKLLSLVAEQLIDSNSNVNDKDAGYVENQQRNIADAIDLLPRLTTGIDVNIKFHRINDFEFTSECTIFDLLDIPLYHGWLVDPQDYETAKAIGSKSYNTLMGELVTLAARKMEKCKECKVKSEEDCIDFAAATAATLGVPSPSLSRAKSFDDSLLSPSEQQKLRKGDAEEEAEFLRVLKLSETELTEEDVSVAPVPSGEVMTAKSDENLYQMDFVQSNPVHIYKEHDQEVTFRPEPSIWCDSEMPVYNDMTPYKRCPEQADLLSSKVFEASHVHQSVPVQSGDDSLPNDLAGQSNGETLVQDEISTAPSPEGGPASVNDQGDEIQNTSAADLQETVHEESGPENSTVIAQNAGSDSSEGSRKNIEATDSFTSHIDGEEPIYEGEECILDSGATACHNREPVYEGEAVLAVQADEGTRDDVSLKDEITPQQGELIENFLKNNASQLTFYGLFSLQEGLKERELCVFFRNNHFSTMFKFGGQLYLLATDQGYINQPDLVWEKLNEVNGDTIYMSSDFKEFRLESNANGTWDEQNAVANTADYLASLNSSEHGGSTLNSDLQLAIALQQQELEQQPHHHSPQQPSNGSSRMTTGPQVPRTSAKSSSSSTKQDRKSKDNCAIM
ncbi:hypothetical protein Ancab_014866 [Ancistrocladus abbreviatus]